MSREHRHSNGSVCLGPEEPEPEEGSMSVLLFLFVAAFIATIVSALGKCPLWVAVVLLCIAGLLSVMPLAR